MSADALPPLLTDERIRSLWSAMGSFTERDADNRMFARAVEAASRAPLLRRIEDMQAEIAQMESRKDAAYLERNQCVSLIARMAVAMGWRAGVARTAIEGWSEDWHGCVYIELPAGQVSWHFHDSQAYLFAGLPAYTGTWDGHDTPEKYRRVAEPVQAEIARLRAEREAQPVAWQPSVAACNAIAPQKVSIAAPQAAPEREAQPVGTDDVVGYVARWGGKCRDCADENGICPNSGLPCGGARKAIEHVISALQYGVRHGYITSPLAAPQAAPAPTYGSGLASQELADALRLYFPNGPKEQP